MDIESFFSFFVFACWIISILPLYLKIQLVMKFLDLCLLMQSGQLSPDIFPAPTLSETSQVPPLRVSVRGWELTSVCFWSEGVGRRDSASARAMHRLCRKTWSLSFPSEVLINVLCSSWQKRVGFRSFAKFFSVSQKTAHPGSFSCLQISVPPDFHFLNCQFTLSIFFPPNLRLFLGMLAIFPPHF